MPSTQERGSGGVKSVRRALLVLSLLAANRSGLTFPEIVATLALPKSSVFELLQTLLNQKWIVLDDTDRRYRVGVRAWEVGQGFVRGVDLAARAKKHLNAAEADLNETIQLGILDGSDVIYIAKLEGSRALRLMSEVGSRFPAYSAGLGKVLLAALDEDEIARRHENVVFEQFTKQTVRDLPELLKKLEVVRAQGYALDDGEYTNGVFCVAVAIQDHLGKVAASLSCALPRSRIDTGEVDQERIHAVLAEKADLISQELGWNGPRPRGRPDCRQGVAYNPF
jgi:IclR family transcriptional regulator, KDG regulon repressor